MSLGTSWPNPSATQVLGERVRTPSEALGLSQEATAHQIGIHWTFLGQVERGQRNLNLPNWLKIAKGSARTLPSSCGDKSRLTTKPSA